MEIDFKKIKKVIEILENSSLSEIELKEGERSLRLSRQTHHTPVTGAAPTITQPIVTQPAHSKQPLPDPLVPTASVSVHTEHVIRSPMVGTYYSAASPQAKPFISIGQTIKVGDVLCIVEAMKMFNEIESDRNGKIIDILVKNGDPIEYDQPLFVVE